MATNFFPNYDKPEAPKPAPAEPMLPKAAPEAAKAVPARLTETPKAAPVKKRPWIPGRLKAAFIIGGLIGSGIAWGAAEWRFASSPKGRAIADIIKAADRCGDVNEKYRERLYSILRASHGSSVELLNLNGVRVCLDRSFSDKEFLMAAYYSKSKTLVLRDDGNLQTLWKRISKPYVVGHVPDAVNTLPETLTMEWPKVPVIYASAFGKYLNTRVEWWSTRDVSNIKPALTQR